MKVWNLKILLITTEINATTLHNVKGIITVLLFNINGTQYPSET